MNGRETIEQRKARKQGERESLGEILDLLDSLRREPHQVRSVVKIAKYLLGPDPENHPEHLREAALAISIYDVLTRAAGPIEHYRKSRVLDAVETFYCGTPPAKR